MSLIKISGDIPDEIAAEIIKELAKQEYRIIAKRASGAEYIIGPIDISEKWDIKAKK